MSCTWKLLPKQTTTVLRRLDVCDFFKVGFLLFVVMGYIHRTAAFFPLSPHGLGARVEPDPFFVMELLAPGAGGRGGTSLSLPILVQLYQIHHSFQNTGGSCKRCSLLKDHSLVVLSTKQEDPEHGKY